MRTTRRIAKKWAERMVARGFSLPLMLTKAKPSFYALRDVGQQRQYLADQMTRKLGVKASVASYVVKRWMPESVTHE